MKPWSTWSKCPSDCTQEMLNSIEVDTVLEKTLTRELSPRVETVHVVRVEQSQFGQNGQHAQDHVELGSNNATEHAQHKSVPSPYQNMSLVTVQFVMAVLLETEPVVKQELAILTTKMRLLITVVSI